MNYALKYSPPEDFWSCAIAVKNKWENAPETTPELLLNNLLCDLCNEYLCYLLGSVGNLGRKSLDSSSELQKELRSLNTRTKYSHFCGKPDVLCATSLSPEPHSYLLSSTTSIQCIQVTVFCIGNTWRISAFSTPHRTTCLVSPRLKANTGEWREEYSSFIFSYKLMTNKRSMSFLTFAIRSPGKCSDLFPSIFTGR